ncbi:undecaprenyl-diphosphatase [Caloramator fervidus]|uniref:Undecaprenyl-diphosphatase n=1 Tax=Caloramator fervidus TaxID=29344 RepID=A0A1H5WM38_9CLOT|nr:phosphatase PAP2 family protein [Caloramator fervidus]SEG00393.1 undecaprenyl-diphosphatase [Caloramator fervidus]
MERFLQEFINMVNSFGILGLIVISFVESSFFPIPPDVILLPMMYLNKKMAFFYAFITALFSVLGGVFGYFLGSKFGDIFSKFFDNSKIKRVEVYFKKYGGWAVLIAGFTPIPYKIFTISAGIFKIPKRIFIIASFIGRFSRFILEAFLVIFLKDADKFIRNNFEYLTIGVTLIFIMFFYAYKTVIRYRHFEKFIIKIKNLNIWLKLKVIDRVGFYTLTMFILSIFILMLMFEFIEDHGFNLFLYYDLKIYEYFIFFRNPALNFVFKVITSIGNFESMLILTLVISIILMKQNKKDISIYFVINIFLVWIFNEFLKYLFKRPRPIMYRLIEAKGYSFPSGHAMVCLTFMLFICFILENEFNVKSRLIKSTLVILALLIGFSRVYLGVHYFSDVIAGWIVAIIYFISAVIVWKNLKGGVL